MIIVGVLYLTGGGLIFASIAGIVYGIYTVNRMFLPGTGEIIYAGIIFLFSALAAAAGVAIILRGISLHKKEIVRIAHRKAITTETSSADIEALSSPAVSISNAASKVLTYCFTYDTFLKPDLQEISSTLSSLSGLFKNVNAVLDRRFTGGLTAQKYKQGVESLRTAILTRIDNQIFQLCAVNEDELQRKSGHDADCRRSLNKIMDYVAGTKTLLDRTVGLVSRLALEAMDCSNDVLEQESQHIKELVQELKEYR